MWVTGHRVKGHLGVPLGFFGGLGSDVDADYSHVSRDPTELFDPSEPQHWSALRIKILEILPQPETSLMQLQVIYLCKCIIRERFQIRYLSFFLAHW